MTGFNRNGVITFLNVFGAGELNYFLGSNSDQLLEVMGKSGRESLNSSYINQSNTNFPRQGTMPSTAFQGSIWAIESNG